MNHRAACLAFVLWFVFSWTAQAEEPVPPPTDYYKITQNHKYVFVMLAPKGKGSEKNKILRKRYRYSGLYLNDGSTRPLWTVDWYAYSIYVSSDGKHLVRMGQWPKVLTNGEANLDQLAFSFYENGKLAHHYMISDLVLNPAVLQVSEAHFNWIKDLSYEDEASRLQVATLDGRRFLFDVTTGETVKSKLVAAAAAA